jgi:hypothetical protein
MDAQRLELWAFQPPSRREALKMAEPRCGAKRENGS